MPPAQLTPLSTPASLQPRSSMHPQVELWAQLHASLLDYCIAQGLNAWADVLLRIGSPTPPIPASPPAQQQH